MPCTYTRMADGGTLKFTSMWRREAASEEVAKLILARRDGVTTPPKFERVQRCSTPPTSNTEMRKENLRTREHRVVLAILRIFVWARTGFKQELRAATSASPAESDCAIFPSSPQPSSGWHSTLYTALCTVPALEGLIPRSLRAGRRRLYRRR